MKADNLLAFMGGAILGACAALLFAPSAGDETRRKLKESMNKEIQDIKEKYLKLEEEAINETEEE